jgi:acetyl-CoA carboxylase biotin carboxyl carrier protein
MTGGPVDVGAVLAGLREQVHRLVADVSGPLRRVSMRSGDTCLEIEWHGAEPAAVPVSGQTPAPAPAGEVRVDPTVLDTAVDDGRVSIRAPIVGTFYRAPEPGAAPFVAVGDQIEPGQVVGIVEAMKLMNHIVAEQGGKVAEVLVGDAEPVEFDQPLITLLPA